MIEIHTISPYLMTHYYCPGSCKGVADEADLDMDQPIVCQAETCEKHGQPLEKCDCEDMSAHSA